MRPLRLLLCGLFFVLGAGLTAQLCLPQNPVLNVGGAAGAVSGWRSGGGEGIVSFGAGLGRYATVGVGQEHRVVQSEHRVARSLALEYPVGTASGDFGLGETGFTSSLFNPSTAPAAAPRPFDFTRAAPHLAFFCRLEINENAGFVIPATFRLGGHRYWQDNLLRE